ncbi:hypothetical protein NDU88_004092 [Pleurodeles waltl]|uniref:Uncharacterized protein n=1 Tax=Pleurodeles waltl TaxID=8319 RepID=A0AAV7WUJ8_PLEWA|nr:hypothetical protein NDU88_004092 [Pleurodeles waltl]
MVGDIGRKPGMEGQMQVDGLVEMLRMAKAAVATHIKLWLMRQIGPKQREAPDDLHSDSGPRDSGRTVTTEELGSDLEIREEPKLRHRSSNKSTKEADKIGLLMTKHSPTKG